MVQRTSLLEQSELDEVELPKRRDKGGGEDGDDDMEGDDPMEVVRTRPYGSGVVESGDGSTVLALVVFHMVGHLTSHRGMLRDPT